LTGETNDFVSICVFALTEPASVTFLMPRRNHYNPK